ncbi:MAG: T9SS type A sorting domain-containing protein [Ignavibacteriales bacterium]|nr:T9SS type A sorting domain-containing protein [Ignavibacteriales bacterium]MBI3006305.1 T9SS type A sorting domain-containing protein [Ignavibacteriales bacterium]
MFVNLLVSDVQEESKNPATTFRLHEAYPNPFNPSTMVTFDLPHESHVKITVYDILGREVQTLLNGLQLGGTHLITFDPSRLRSGIYFCRADAGTWSDVKKLVYIR